MPARPDPLSIERWVEWHATCTSCKGELISTSQTQQPQGWWHTVTSLPDCPTPSTTTPRI